MGRYYGGLILFVLTIYFYQPLSWALSPSGYQSQATLIPNQDSSGQSDWDKTGAEFITTPDPIQPYNLAIFSINDKLYFYFLKPIAQGYRKVLPEKARVSIRNLYNNVNTPSRLVNSLLQRKFKGAGTEILRFVINTTMGIGGLFDPAKSLFCLEKQDEDFGQTLGSYGMGPVFYIEWPFLGPSSLRDTVGLAADVALDPLTFLIGPWEHFGISAYDYINELSLEKDTYESIVEPAVDPYLAVQDAYIQNRAKKIRE
jgi:phospholipid-binding lipoprotein MlaA